MSILTDQATPRSASTYWAVLKKRLIEEGAQLLTNCKQLKMKAADGKKRLTDVANTEQLLRIVQPTGEIEDDPDLTDKTFPGNPTKSYRSTEPFRVIGEVSIWQGHPTEQIKAMKDALERLKEQGINSLND